MLTGVHVGCYELFASDRIRTVHDLRGKTIGVTELGSGRHVFLVSLMSYVGLDAKKDVTLIHAPTGRGGGALRVRDHRRLPGVSPRKPRSCVRGRSGTRSSAAPWSAPGRNTSAAWSPATENSSGAARFLVDRGFATQYEYVLQLFKNLPYTKWRVRAGRHGPLLRFASDTM